MEMPNRLSQEKSPYLLQHASNPVDWYPWGEEAFQKARDEDKPIFLSIGYSTCHWCHVMERESFEDLEVARLLNENFVSVKVDREERPDVDQLYMNAYQMLRGSGGWPLSIFMTPEKKPFFAGSYFPKESRLGMAGFMDILRRLTHLWKNERSMIALVSGQITGAIELQKQIPHSGFNPTTLLREAYEQLRASFDERWGGFSKAPKFPTPHQLTFLLRWYARTSDRQALAMVEQTLRAMRNGGIFDQIGYGFHRYAVDEKWLVPHFEKMLYDQALLAIAFLETYQLTCDTYFSQAAEEIFQYVLRDMTEPSGLFFSAEDADSEGEEGLFYVWTPAEVKAVLGEEDGRLYCLFYDISTAGNFEKGKSIPHISKSLEVVAKQNSISHYELAERLIKAKRKLFEARQSRVRPFKDDKVLACWNGLMIAAFAKGYQVLGDKSYLDAASKCADSVLSLLRDTSGEIYRRYRRGHVAQSGFADDYAFLIWGLIEVYESTFEMHYLDEALSIQEKMLDLFWDDRDGGFFFTHRSGEQLLVKSKEIQDGAVPSSNSVAALNLLRLARMTGNTEWEEKANRLFDSFSGLVARFPAAFTQFLQAVDFALGPGTEMVIVGKREEKMTQEMISEIHRRFLPNRVLMFINKGADNSRLIKVAPHLKSLGELGEQTGVYICENYSCKTPLFHVDELKLYLDESR